MENTNILFYEIAEEWLIFKKSKVKESTYENYNFVVHRRLNKTFRNMSIEELKEYNYNLYMERLMRKLSHKTVKDTVITLKSILYFANERYEANIRTDLIHLPGTFRKEILVFSHKEQNKIKEYCLHSEDTSSIGVLVSLFTGLRIGEICALKWKDIDFENATIKVSSTLQRIYKTNRVRNVKSTEVILTSPKTRYSIRTIPLNNKLYQVLKPLSKKYKENAFILTGREDKYIEPISYRNKYKKLLEKLNINYKKYHCLRHTFATKCQEIGMDSKGLSEILGHSSVNITLDIYVHSSFEMKKKYINKL